MITIELNSYDVTTVQLALSDYVAKLKSYEKIGQDFTTLIGSCNRVAKAIEVAITPEETTAIHLNEETPTL